MLTKVEFEVLKNLILEYREYTQRELAEIINISLGKVNAVITELKSKGLLNKNGRVTQSGFEAMIPYKVNNAIIMAAGMSSRFAPLSYEKPKALLNVKGELIIEREIRQLKEAGIENITVVVGYMKEKLFYLADKYGVEIIVNEDYYRYNNTSTLKLVTNKLSNTYICSSDNYFSSNPFEQYVYRSYYAAVYSPGDTNEYCITVNNKDRIIDVTVGGNASWYMLGHVYFDRNFSKNFVRILEDEYDKPVTKEHLWEDLYIKHIESLEMYIRRYDSSVIKEFDSLEELRCFDENYLVNADSTIFRNICKFLNCKESDIMEIHPIKTGMTNMSFSFVVGKRKYIYRHPGIGTEAYINRQSEAYSMQIAKELGLDDTFIYLDPLEGWKLSYYVENAVVLDYHNDLHVQKALVGLKKLHNSGRVSEYEFDIWKQINCFREALDKSNKSDFEDMRLLYDDLSKVYDNVNADMVSQTICHCDSYNPNFIFDEHNKMYLVDWEYSGMADPAVDIGTFVVCSDYSMDEVDKVIEIYMGEKPSKEVYRHYIGYMALSAFYWFMWALYQESIGKTVGKYLYVWYMYTKTYSRKALELYLER